MSRLLVHRLLLVATICFWIICAMLTHVPVPPGFIPAAENDKIRHFVGFAILATLFFVALLTSSHARPPLRSALLVLIILMLYAIIDEVTQPVVGRRCELGDWIADSTGAAIALTLALVITTLVPTVRTIEKHGSSNA
jgi:VanZ family protein